MTELSTRDKLLKIGKEEFLAKGYKDASLREIAKKAGFTLGAFYGYYRNKEALFDDIVSEAGQKLFGYYKEVHNHFKILPEDLQAKEMSQTSHHGLMEMVEIIYADFDTYKLLFHKAAGTQYEHYAKWFIDEEVEATYNFIEVLSRQGKASDVDDELLHILITSMFTGFLEVLDHDMSKEKAATYIAQLDDFYSAGWQRLLKWYKIFNL